MKNNKNPIKYVSMKRPILFSLILCIIFLNVAGYAAEVTTAAEIGYLNFDNSRSYNLSDTIEVYNERPSFSGLTEVDGNNRLRISLADPATNQTTTLSYGVTRIAFDKLPTDKDYYISWDFCLYGGGNIVFNPFAFAQKEESKNTSVGVIRLQADGLVSAKSGWTTPEEEDGSTIKISDMINIYHNIEGVRKHSTNTFAWYLDGVKVSEYEYAATAEVGFMYIQTDKGSGNVGDTLADIDNITTGLCEGDFSAVAEGKANSADVTVRFNRYPKTLPNASDITLVDNGGNRIGVTEVKQNGNSIKLKLSQSLSGGKSYIIDFGVGTFDRESRKIKTVMLDVSPVDFSVKAEPKNLGGIFDDTETPCYAVTVTKKTGKKDYKVNAVAYNSDNQQVWTSDSNFSMGKFENTKTFCVYPKIYLNTKRYGLFTLKITVTNKDDEVGSTISVPFSQIMSNDVLNYKMGTSTHYAERYQNTDNISGQIALNTKAGMGIDRDDVSWHNYDNDPIHTLKGRLLEFYQGAKSADMIPMGVMTHGVWKYDIGKDNNGRFAGIAKYEGLEGATDEEIAQKEEKAKFQLEKFGEYIKAFAKETAAYAKNDYNSTLDGNFLEIGNEWDLGYYNQTYADRYGKEQKYGVQPYVDILKTAWNAVQDIQNRPRIVGIVSAVANKESYLKVMGEYLDAGAADYCDAISLHPYYWTQSPEEYDICGLIEDTNKLFDEKNIPRKPLIFSEWGSSSALVHNKNQQKQAAQAVRGMALVGTMTDSVIWYTGQEKNYDDSVAEEKLGLIKSGNDKEYGGVNFAAKPVYAAIACYNSLTADLNQQMWQKDSNGTYTCRFTSDDKEVIMYWNPDKSAEVTFSKKDGYTVAIYDMYGNRNVKSSVYKSYSQTATATPGYIVYQKNANAGDGKSVIKDVKLLSDFSDNNKITADNLTNNNGYLTVDIESYKSEKIGEGIIAMYSDGKLVGITTKSITSNGGGKQRFNILWTPVDDNTGNTRIDKVKGFVWSGIDGMLPLTDSVTIDN